MLWVILSSIVLLLLCRTTTFKLLTLVLIGVVLNPVFILLALIVFDIFKLRGK